jgi:hypothetical protein
MPALSVPPVRRAQAPQGPLLASGVAFWILKEFPRTVGAPHEAAAGSRSHGERFLGVRGPDRMPGAASLGPQRP